MNDSLRLLLDLVLPALAVAALAVGGTRVRRGRRTAAVEAVRLAADQDRVLAAGARLAARLRRVERIEEIERTLLDEATTALGGAVVVLQPAPPGDRSTPSVPCRLGEARRLTALRLPEGLHPHRARLALAALAGEAELAARRLADRQELAASDARRELVTDLEARLVGADDVFGATHLAVRTLAAAVPARWAEVSLPGIDPVTISLTANGAGRDGELLEMPLAVADGTLRVGLARPVDEEEERVVHGTARALGRALAALGWRAAAARSRLRQNAVVRATAAASGRPTEALRTLALAAHEAFDAGLVVIYELEEREARPLLTVGGPPVTRLDGVAAQALAAARPVLDVDGSYLAAEPVPEMVAGIAAPLPGGSAGIGAVSVLFPEPRRLDERDATDVAAFAQLAALTLERALLERELERREVLRAGFVEIAETLAGSREPSETYDAVATAACRALRAEGSVVVAGDGTLSAVGGAGPRPALVDADGVAGTLLALAAREGRLVLCPDVAGDARLPADERARLLDRDERSALCLPIAPGEGGRAEIVLGVVWSEAHAAVDEDLELARHLATAGAAAIERAEVLAAARHGRARAQDLQRVSDLVSSKLEAPAVLREVVAQAAALLEADAGALRLADGDRLVVRATSGRAGERLAGEAVPLSTGVVGEVLARRAPLAVADAAADGRVPDGDAAVQAGLRSLLAVPIVSPDGSLRGVLSVYDDDVRAWTADEAGVLERFASSATVALQNALLFERVAEEKGKSDTILASIADGIVVVGADGEIEMWNRAAEQMTGVEARRALGRPLHEVLASELADDGESAAKALDEVAVEGGTAEIRIGRGDRETWLAVRAAGLRDVEQGTGTVYALRDVSEDRQLDQLKSDFVATVSHELRTPLTSIYGFAETMLRSDATFSGEDRATFLRYIASEAERLTRLVDGLLSVARLEAGGISLELADVDVGEVLSEIVTRESGRLAETHRLELHVPEDPLIAAVDRDKLRQIILNLVDNAIKYSPRGGTVEVRAERRLDAVEIRVRDEGIGISAADQRNLFRKFFRADARMTRGIRGIGLGLYLTRGFVTAMGGRIGVESVEGVGSTFVVDLPLRPNSEHGAQAA